MIRLMELAFPWKASLLAIVSTISRYCLMRLLPLFIRTARWCSERRMHVHCLQDNTDPPWAR